MTLSLDMSVRVAEIVAVVIVLAMMKSDVNWMKEELKHLRTLCESNFGIRRKD